MPRLRERWGETLTPMRQAAGPEGAWTSVKAAVTRARGPIRDEALARSAGELLNVVATGSKDRELLEAVRRYDRAYREPGGRRAQTGRQAADLRQAAVTLALIGRLTGDRDKPPLLALAVGLAALLEAVGGMREAQDRLHQASAARDAAAAVKRAVGRLQETRGMPAAGTRTLSAAYTPPPGPEAGRGR